VLKNNKLPYKIMKYNQFFPAIIISLLFTNNIQAQTINHVQEVVSHLVGIMDTSAQSQVNYQRVNVQMTTCKVTLKDDLNSVYLYQEQALATKLNQPYRQRILKIIPLANNLVESKAYKLKNKTQFINFCNQLKDNKILAKNDLTESVCSVFLRPVVTIYIGETPPEGCVANVRGAVKITNKIILHSQGMDTFDQGFDAEGKQVWGAVNDSYQFRWVKK
jgi:CpeT/CpcT family (DUF1001)